MYIAQNQKSSLPYTSVKLGKQVYKIGEEA